MSWPVEDIPEEGVIFYRQAHICRHLDKLNPIDPDPSVFEVGEEEDGLSVYWNKYADVERVYMHIGLSDKYLKPGQRKNPKEFRVYSIDWTALRGENFVSAAVHDPKYHPDPFPPGDPSNRSHSLIHYRTRGKMLAVRARLLAHVKREPEIDVEKQVEKHEKVRAAFI